VDVLRATLEGLKFYDYVEYSLDCDANLVQYANHWIDGIDFAQQREKLNTTYQFTDSMGTLSYVFRNCYYTSVEAETKFTLYKESMPDLLTSLQKFKENIISSYQTINKHSWPVYTSA